MTSDLIAGFVARASSVLSKPFELEVAVFRDCRGLLKLERLNLVSQVRSERKSSDRVTLAATSFVNFSKGLWQLRGSSPSSWSSWSSQCR